jgi:hypothetical protein
VVERATQVFRVQETCASVSGIADPFNGHIDECRGVHVQRSDAGAFAAAGAEEQEGSEPPLLPGGGVVVCLMG